jgi:hypothetical protein
MSDFKKVAITINDELLIALKGQKILVELMREQSPPKAYKIVGKDIEKRMLEIENQISRVKARKQELLNKEE